VQVLCRFAVIRELLRRHDRLMSFDDRFRAETYGNDPRYEVRLVPNPQDVAAQPPESAWIPERLVLRLRHLALAYELPLLSRVPICGRPDDETWTYPEQQLVRLEEEWAFLADRMKDDLLVGAFSPVLSLLAHGQVHPRGWSLVVEAP
jgi:hypothetical protein